MKTGSNKHSMVGRLRLLFFVFSITPVIIVGSISYFFAKNLSKKYAVNVTFTAQKLVDELEQDFQQSQIFLEVMSDKSTEFSEITTRTDGTELALISSVLRSTLASQAKFSHFIVTAPDRTILASSEPASPWIGTVFQADASYGKALSEAKLSHSSFDQHRLGDSLIPGIWIHAPLYSAWNKQDAIGVLSGLIRYEQFQKIIQATPIDGKAQSNDRYFSLISSNFEFSQTPLTGEALPSRRLSEIREVLVKYQLASAHPPSWTDTHGEKLVGYAQSSPLGLVILASIDSAVAYRQINTLGIFLLVFTIVLITITLPIIPYISHNISQPLTQLLTGVRKISDGDLDYTVELRTQDEFEELGQAFNHMTKNLLKSEAERNKSQLDLQRELQLRVKIVANLAHRVNNPLNHSLVSSRAIEQDLREIETILSAIFTSVEPSPETQYIHGQLTKNLDHIRSFLRTTDRGIVRSAQIVEEIRSLSGVDGYALEECPVDLLVLDALDRFAQDKGQDLRQMISYDLSKLTDCTLMLNRAVMILALEHLLHDFSARLPQGFHLIGERAPHSFAIEWKSRDNTVLFLQPKEIDELNYILRPFHIRVEAEGQRIIFREILRKATAKAIS